MKSRLDAPKDEAAIGGRQPDPNATTKSIAPRQSALSLALLPTLLALWLAIVIGGFLANDASMTKAAPSQAMAPSSIPAIQSLAAPGDQTGSQGSDVGAEASDDPAFNGLASQGPASDRSSLPVPDQAATASPLPWQIQTLAQAGGATGPVVVVGSLAYVGRGPVVAVADISQPAAPKWVGYSDVLGGAVTDLAMTEGHLLATVGRDGYQEELFSLSLAQATAPRRVGRLDLPPATLGLFAASGQVWLSQVQRMSPQTPVGTRERVLSMAVDGAGRPVGRPVWEAVGSNERQPFYAPILRQMGPDELVLLGSSIDGGFDDARSFAVGPAGRLLPRARLELGAKLEGAHDSRALAIDPQQRRAFVALAGTLRVLDLMPDGQLRQRGLMAIPGTVGCGGLYWTGRWLLATSGCMGDSEALLIDVSDPDRPRLGAALKLSHAIARLAQAGDFLVASAGQAGGLSILRLDSSAALTEVGRIEDPLVITGIVETGSGRFAMAPGQGIVRLAAVDNADWARSELVYPLPDVTDLVAGPAARLVASEARGAFASAKLHVLATDGATLRLQQRIAMEANWAGNLTTVGADLYVGLDGGKWMDSKWVRLSPLERWRFDAGGLSLQARTDPAVYGNCYVVGDKVYVGVGAGMVVLDPVSLVPLRVFDTDQATDNLCRFALRQEPGQPPRFIRANDRSVFAQRIEGSSLRTIGSAALPWSEKRRTVGSVRDAAGDAAVVGYGGLVLADARSELAPRLLAELAIDSETELSLSPWDDGGPTLAPGRRWLLSSPDMGMLLITTVASPLATVPAGPSPEPWTSPSPAPPRPQAMPAATPSGLRLFLPVVADHAPVAWPNPFAERISVGPLYRGIAVDGTRAWVGDGRTVALFQEDGKAARLLDRSANLPAAPRLLAAGADRLVAVAGERGFLLLDRPSDRAPTLQGQLELPERAVDLILDADHAYVATAYCGIVVIDLRQAARPRISAILDLSFRPRQLLIVDGMLLCLGWEGSETTPVAVAKLDDPSLPVWLAWHSLPRFSAAATDDRRLFTNGSPGIPVLEASLSAYTVTPEGGVVEDEAWLAALQGLPGAANLKLALQSIAASPDRLLLSPRGEINMVALAGDGLPQRLSHRYLGADLFMTRMALSGRSAWALTWGSTTNSSLEGPNDFGVTLGSLLWLNLEETTDGASAPAPAQTWFADAPEPMAVMARFGDVLCLGMDTIVRDTAWTPIKNWRAMDISDPRRARPLGRLSLPDDVYWMVPTGEASALALRWSTIQNLGSVLRLDLSDPLHPKVVEALSLGPLLPLFAARSGDFVAIHLADQSSGSAQPISYRLLRDRPGQPLSDLGPMDISGADGLYNASFFADGGRGYLAVDSVSAADEAGVRELGTQVRVLAYDLQSRPPRLLDYLPFKAMALRRIGDEVFALLPPALPGGPKRLATVLLADPPSRSSIRQVIDLGDSGPLDASRDNRYWDERGAVLDQLTALPDGSLIWPVQSVAKPPEFSLRRLRRSGPSGLWNADPGLALDVDGIVSPSLSYKNGWLAFMVRDDQNNRNDWTQRERGMLELLRVGW